MPKNSLQPVFLQHIGQLKSIALRTFWESFGHLNESADFRAYIQKAFTTIKLRKEVENPNSRFFLLWENRMLAGYLKVNTGDAQTEPVPDALEVERIYLLRAFQRKGLGQLLLEKAMELAYEEQKRIIWLGVWEHNRRAIQFYKKNGFEPFSRHPFWVGKDRQTDILMQITIR